MAGKIYVAKVDGLVDYDGRQVPIKAGITRVREGHPLLEGRESVFEELQVHYDVETARQAPKAESKPDPEPAKAEPAKSEAKAETAEGSGEAKAPAKSAARPQRGPRKA